MGVIIIQFTEFHMDNSHIFSCSRNAQVAFSEWKINSLHNYNHFYLTHNLSDKAFKDTIVNRTLPSLHERLLK